MSERPPELHPRLMTREEAARHVRASATTFDKLVAEGIWPKPIRHGRYVRWDKVTLDQRIMELQGIRSAAEPSMEERALQAIRDRRSRDSESPALRRRQA